MEKIKLICLLLIFFYIEGCTPIYYNIKSGFVTSKIKENQLFYFVDSLINNYNNYIVFIKKSQLFDKVYSDSVFRPFVSRYLNECLEKGYSFPDEYSFNIEDQNCIKYRVFKHHDIIERYPKLESIEGKLVHKIANIHLTIKGRESNYNENNGDLVFTFCQRKDGTWYFRGVNFEYVIY